MEDNNVWSDDGFFPCDDDGGIYNDQNGYDDNDSDDSDEASAVARTFENDWEKVCGCEGFWMDECKWVEMIQAWLWITY